MEHPSSSRMESRIIHRTEVHGKVYQKLLSMIVLSFISMQILMYAMVNVLANMVPNLNQFYMAGLMTLPMIIIELSLMAEMYKKKRRNSVIVAASFVGLIAFYSGIRYQAFIEDKPFLKSMIPPHAGAVLMAEGETNRYHKKKSDQELTIIN